jgi:hypothetical protein
MPMPERSRVMQMHSTRQRLARWTARLMACTLVAAALTAFLVHLGAADPWRGGTVVPATVWLAWMAFDFALASRLAGRGPGRRGAVGAPAGPALVDSEAGSTPP